MKREPSLYITAIGTVLSLIAAFGLKFLTPEQAALVIVVLNAALGAWNAYRVRPIAPAAFTYLVAAVATLVAAYGIEVGQSVVGSVNAAVLAVLALVLRGNVSPVVTTPAAAELAAR